MRMGARVRGSSCITILIIREPKSTPSEVEQRRGIIGGGEGEGARARSEMSFLLIGAMIGELLNLSIQHVIIHRAQCCATERSR